jgi:hypothetical protein
VDSLFDVQNLEQSLQDRIREYSDRYRAYGLRTNPFPLGGNYPDTYLLYTYFDAARMAQIRDFLISTFVREEFDGMVVLGEYGSGKSHVLNYVQDVVNTDPFFAKEALCFLIQNPSVVPEDILVSMLRAAKFSVIGEMIFQVVQRELVKKYAGRIPEFLSDFTNFGVTGGLVPDYVPQAFQHVFSLSHYQFMALFRQQGVKLSHRKLQDFAQEALAGDLNVRSETLPSDLAGLIATDDTFQAWESFLTSRLLSPRRSLGTEYYLEAFLQLFRASGTRHIYLLVDELEDLRTQRVNKKQATEYLATLRRMIQHNYRMFSFVLACTRDAWNDLKGLYPAIEDRFPIALDLASSALDIKAIVGHYLGQVRVDDGSPAQEWQPFTEEAVDEVIRRRGLVLRHVLTEMRSLLDAAADQQIPPPIGVAFVQMNLAQTLRDGA